MSNRITAYVHAVSGEQFPADRYVNHGYGGVHRERLDLPADGYPYAVVIEDGRVGYAQRDSRLRGSDRPGENTR